MKIPSQLSIWIDFAKNPAQLIDLLLIPYDDTSSAKLAQYLQPKISQLQRELARLTPVEASVAVEVGFDSFVHAILPATGINLRERC